MIEQLQYPIVQAPMAGGVATPALAAAICEAGGLGFLAGGYQTAEALREEMKQLKEMTSKPFGVNLFVPSADPIDEEALVSYQKQIEQEAERLGEQLGAPYADDDDWVRKLALVKEERVPVVSFTFGCPSAFVLRELQEAGIYTIVTVTTPLEAMLAAGAGADALCVQGIEAGGHRASFDNDDEEDYPLQKLLTIIRQEVSLPLIAAGGMMTGADIARALQNGAVAAQLGTAFLCCPESGAHAVYKAALRDDSFSETAITRAFTGKRARGIVNRFLTQYDAVAPAAYPQLHHITKSLRKAAAQANDPSCMSLWAGQGYKQSEELSAAALVEKLWKEMTHTI